MHCLPEYRTAVCLNFLQSLIIAFAGVMDY